MLGLALMWWITPDVIEFFATETFTGSVPLGIVGALFIVAGPVVGGWLWIRPSRNARPEPMPLVDEPARQLQVVDRAMVRTHRARPHVQPVVCPDPPTQVLSRVDDDATQVLPHAALNSPTQVLYIVLPVDERERAR